MAFADLHVHSNASDGTLSPSEVVTHAIQCNLCCIALTDHDTLAGIKEAKDAALQAKNQGNELKIISGTEISVAYKGRDIHILGLFVNEEDPQLQSVLSSSIQTRNQRNETMVCNLSRAGIPITMDDLNEDANGGVITRAHFANVLLKKQVVKSKEEAFRKYLDSTTPYYVPRKFLAPEEAIAFIHGAGGIAILAHPLLYHYKSPEVERLVRYLKDLGLDGIEAIYSANSQWDDAYVKSLARKYDLLISGGSDFHGANKPSIELGIGRGNLKIPYALVETMEQYRFVKYNK